MPEGTPTRPLRAHEGWYKCDDFIANDSVADAAVGEMDWEIATIGNASTLALQTGLAGGVLRLTTAATADGDGEVMRLFTDGLALGGAGGGFAIRFRYVTAVASHNFRFGFQDGVAAADPAVGLFIFSDGGVLSLNSDSTNGDKDVAAASVSTLTGGTTAVADTWHYAEVIFSGANGNGGPGLATLYVDGEAAASLYPVIGSAETMELSFVHYQDSGGASAKAIDIDFLEAWQWVDRNG